MEESMDMDMSPSRPQNYLSGCELKADRDYPFKVDNDENEHQLSLRTVSLGAGAKDGLHIVEAEAMDYEGSPTKVTLATLKMSVQPTVSLGGFEITPPVVLRLKCGSGPVHNSGRHLVAVEEDAGSEDKEEEDVKLLSIFGKRSAPEVVARFPRKKVKLAAADEDDDDDDDEDDDDDDEDDDNFDEEEKAPVKKGQESFKKQEKTPTTPKGPSCVLKTLKQNNKKNQMLLIQAGVCNGTLDLSFFVQKLPRACEANWTLDPGSHGDDYDKGGGEAVPGTFGGRHGEPRKRPGPDVIGHQLTVLRAPVPPAAAAVPVAEVEATVAPPPAAGLGTAAPGARAWAGAGADTTRPRVAPGSARSAAKRCVNCLQPELGGRETGFQRAAGDAFPAASYSTPPPESWLCQKTHYWRARKGDPLFLGVGPSDSVGTAAYESRLRTCPGPEPVPKKRTAEEPARAASWSAAAGRPEPAGGVSRSPTVLSSAELRALPLPRPGAPWPDLGARSPPPPPPAPRPAPGGVAWRGGGLKWPRVSGRSDRSPNSSPSPGVRSAHQSARAARGASLDPAATPGDFPAASGLPSRSNLTPAAATPLRILASGVCTGGFSQFSKLLAWEPSPLFPAPASRSSQLRAKWIPTSEVKGAEKLGRLPLGSTAGKGGFVLQPQLGP
ncbi:PREDICTED: transcription initiation factor TFIID subunit 4-like [Bison bison bison]|uniref:Nucleophosmin n=1 Tax=Bison bison bison TaxID=43346 RepID=A0A6P3HTI3_BISBB|nr:PREDICTED: transcription initiation factor TFIID subunit 4-like [Bison bison bison]